MTTTVTAKIQLRAGTAAQWTSANPTLLVGEYGYETDTGKLKIGDGDTEWNDRAYYYDPTADSASLAAHEAAANPHPGYLTPAEGDAAYETVGAVTSHVAGSGVHSIAGVTGLQTALDGKSATSHDHSGTYEPAGTVSTHAAGSGVHSIASVTGLQTALDGKSSTAHDHASTYAPIANGVANGDSHDHSGGDGGQLAYSSLSGLPTLGTAAATAAADYAAVSHAHSASAVTSGTFDTARLGSGTANSGTYLRGDQTWAAAAGGVASDTHAASSKTTPVDADELPLIDSAAGWVLKNLSIANLKAWAAGLFVFLAGKSGGQTVIGGTGVTDKLVLQGTSGNGTSTATALEIVVGNNGNLSALTIANNGQLTIGTLDATSILTQSQILSALQFGAL
jgi:hypothetical protein